LSRFLELPRLDCHAHIAPDVTDGQVQALGEVYIFAVTRTLAEAAQVHTARHPHLIWGCGIHPRLPRAISEYDEGTFRTLVERFMFVGEIGLDAKYGDLQSQVRVFDSILEVISELAVMCSIHSAGAAAEVVRLLAKHRPKGPILHWFTGSPELINDATDIGCAFSVNAAMSDRQLLALPRDRILPETDFPGARGKASVKRPGDVVALEERLGRLWGEPTATVRMRFFKNLRDLALRSDTLDQLPGGLADVIIAA
jgi:TatD DNase family protein